MFIACSYCAFAQATHFGHPIVLQAVECGAAHVARIAAAEGCTNISGDSQMAKKAKKKAKKKAAKKSKKKRSRR